MKKLIIIIFTMLGLVRGAFAGSILDQIYTGFVGNAKFAYESDTDGKSRPGFFDNFFEIGKMKGGYIAAVDSGVGGTILPDTNQFRSAEWSSGAKLHLATFIKNYVNLPDQWAFLSTIEIDGRASYDWTAHHPYYGIVAAYPFK